MLITFKSAAAADVIMFGDAAKRLLHLLGKDPGAATGIFTVEQLPAAIDTLRTAIDADKAQQHEYEADDADPADDQGMAAPVRLAQRAWPLLEMLEYARDEGKPVTWGT
ncbi:DUF1840 domain-containing protein [Nitrogeniibacter mangrovi]|uniref:DUF1840 domain-containing protein n=1 Tax=Nitrogeniibacter mangrovi TaxID=2016596 RepID=A0A6C1AYL8_9RHOO|nr:DUF1840 domain-containing protein [Nitrogeniibacter mangrovi]QID16446.1 DUF1840 domain-containing protein [Nitrogeniibacter mangrovi]